MADLREKLLYAAPNDQSGDKERLNREVQSFLESATDTLGVVPMQSNYTGETISAKWLTGKVITSLQPNPLGQYNDRIPEGVWDVSPLPSHILLGKKDIAGPAVNKMHAVIVVPSDQAPMIPADLTERVHSPEKWLEGTLKYVNGNICYKVPIKNGVALYVTGEVVYAAEGLDVSPKDYFGGNRYVKIFPLGERIIRKLDNSVSFNPLGEPYDPHDENRSKVLLLLNQSPHDLAEFRKLLVGRDLFLGYRDDTFSPAVGLTMALPWDNQEFKNYLAVLQDLTLNLLMNGDIRVGDPERNIDPRAGDDQTAWSLLSLIGLVPRNDFVPYLEKMLEEGRLPLARSRYSYLDCYPPKQFPEVVKKAIEACKSGIPNYVL